MTPEEFDWIERNIRRFVNQANYVARRVIWGGRWQHGQNTPANMIVINGDKVALALESRTDEPHEGSEGWKVLCTLKRMRFPEDSPIVEWIHALDMDDIEKLADSEFLTDVVKGAVQKGQVDMAIWRGLWSWGLKYRTGDIVAYNHGVYQAVTGAGVPGDSAMGWVILDFVSHNQGTPALVGELVTYLGITVTYLNNEVRYA